MNKIFFGLLLSISFFCPESSFAEFCVKTNPKTKKVQISEQKSCGKGARTLSIGSAGASGAMGPQGPQGPQGPAGASFQSSDCFEVKGKGHVYCEDPVAGGEPSFFVASHYGYVDLTNSASGMCVLDAVRPARKFVDGSSGFGGSSGGTGPIVGVSYSAVCNSAASCIACGTEVIAVCCPIHHN